MDAAPVADRNWCCIHRHRAPECWRKVHIANGHARPAHRNSFSGRDAGSNRRAHGHRRPNDYGSHFADSHPAPKCGRGCPACQVREGPLVLRAGPNQTQPTLGSAQAGQAFTVTGRTADNAWLQVCCVNNQPAWLASQFVVVTGTLTTLPVKP